MSTGDPIFCASNARKFRAVWESWANGKSSKQTPVLLDPTGELELYVSNYNDVAVAEQDLVLLNRDIVHGEGMGVGAAADVPLGGENGDTDDGMFRIDLGERQNDGIRVVVLGILTSLQNPGE